MDWKQEVLKRLDALAEKLGTTAVYLWAVLVKQAYLTGIGDGIVALMLFGVSWFSIKCFNKTLVKAAEEDDDWYFASVLLGIVIAVLILSGINYGLDSFRELLNPGYYALHDVLQTLGK